MYKPLITCITTIGNTYTYILISHVMVSGKKSYLTITILDDFAEKQRQKIVHC
jgi:hypothetical protein